MIFIRRTLLLAVAAVAFGIATGCDSLPGRPKPSDEELAPTEIKDFARLYADNCAGCHGANGSLGPATALGNPTYLLIADDTVLRNVISNGVPGTSMPPFLTNKGGPLTDEQIAILIAGIRRWAQPSALAASAPSYASGSIGDPQAATKVFATHCASCHGEDGQGGARGGSIVDGDYLSLTSDQSLRTTIIAGRPDLGHPDWRGREGSDPLSSQQVSDLVAWLAGKRSQAAAAQTASTR